MKTKKNNVKPFQNYYFLGKGPKFFYKGGKALLAKKFLRNIYLDFFYKKSSLGVKPTSFKQSRPTWVSVVEAFALAKPLIKLSQSYIKGRKRKLPFSASPLFQRSRIWHTLAGLVKKCKQNKTSLLLAELESLVFKSSNSKISTIYSDLYSEADKAKVWLKRPFFFRPFRRKNQNKMLVFQKRARIFAKYNPLNMRGKRFSIKVSRIIRQKFWNLAQATKFNKLLQTYYEFHKISK